MSSLTCPVTAAAKVFFFSPPCLCLYTVGLFYSYANDQIGWCFQCVAIKTDAPFCWKYRSWQQDRIKNTGNRHEILDVILIDISILACDFAWWGIKSQLLPTHLIYRKVLGPSRNSGSFGLGTASAAFFCYDMKQFSVWHAGAQEFTAAVTSQATKDSTIAIDLHPSCCNPASDLSDVCHNHKI